MLRPSSRSSRPWLLLTAASALTLVGSVGGVAGVAGAGGIKVDATDYTVTCSGFAGSVKFSQPETTAGTTTASPATDTLKGSLSGCTVGDGGGTPVTVTGAKLSGALTNPSSLHKCGSTGTPVTVTGSLTIKWKATPKLIASSTVITGSSATTSVDLTDSAVNFTIDGASATGPFEGSNSGASDAVAGSTGANSVTGLLASCGSKKGLKGLTLSSPPSGSAATLG